MIIPEFFFIGYMSLLAQYLHSGLFSFFVSLFLCPIAHGYVYCSMKLVDNENASIDYHDSMIGIIDFTRVAPTYLIRKGMILLITLICALPSLYSLLQYIPFLSIEWFASLGNAFIQTEFFVPDFYDIPQLTQNGLVLINLLLCIFVGVIGIHRFYLGYIGIGVIQLLTGGGCGIWTLIDLIRIITGDLQPNGGRYSKTL